MHGVTRVRAQGVAHTVACWLVDTRVVPGSILPLASRRAERSGD